MRLATSSLTRRRCSSQRKKLSPASPDQSVPSQSKTAILGVRCKTESRNAVESIELVVTMPCNYTDAPSFQCDDRFFLGRVHESCSHSRIRRPGSIALRGCARPGSSERPCPHPHTCVCAQSSRCLGA